MNVVSHAGTRNGPDAARPAAKRPRSRPETPAARAAGSSTPSTFRAAHGKLGTPLARHRVSIEDLIASSRRCRRRGRRRNERVGSRSRPAPTCEGREEQSIAAVSTCDRRLSIADARRQTTRHGVHPIAFQKLVSGCVNSARNQRRCPADMLENILNKRLFENLLTEKKRTVNLFLPSLLWANSQLRRLLASGACPMISCAASCRTGDRGS